MKLTEKQLDCLKEIMNVGVGKGASILNTMLNSHIKLQIPFIDIISSDELLEKMETTTRDKLATVDLQFRGEISGISKLVFPSESALRIVDLLIDDFNCSGKSDVDAIAAATLCEIGNIVLNSVIGTMCNYFKINLKYSLPNFIEGKADVILSFGKEYRNDSIILARTSFKIEEMNIDGDVLLIFKIGSFDNMLKMLDLL